MQQKQFCQNANQQSYFENAGHDRHIQRCKPQSHNTMILQ